MPNKLKKDAVAKITDTLKERDSVVLVDYTGLTHQQLAEIRTKIFEAGVFGVSSATVLSSI